MISIHRPVSNPAGLLVSGRVERSRDGRVKALRLVLQSAKRVIKFVEPHFHPETTRFSNAFVAYLSCICESSPVAGLPAIELHTSDKHEGQLFHMKCEHFFCSRLPTGLKLRVVRWPGRRLHYRYVLSENACVILRNSPEMTSCFYCGEKSQPDASARDFSKDC